MSKNVIVNGDEYNGVSEINLNTTDGGTALFRDADEITTPSGTKEITENGVHDVTNYASAVVNVAASGGGASFEKHTGTATVDGYYLVINGVDLIDAKMFIVEFKAQSPESPVETGYTTYGGMIAWIGGLVDDFTLAEEFRTAETTQGDQTYTRNITTYDMYGLCRSGYFNGTDASGNFKVRGMEITSDGVKINVSFPLDASVVFDVVVHYM